MKNTVKALRFPIVSLAIVLLFIACDKDYAVLESDVLGEENTNFNTNTELFQIVAYNKKLEAVQINGLPSNLLGVYNDPAFGQTTASIVTQLLPVTYNPDFGTNPQVESVILNIPYYSRVTGVVDGNSTYTISDSLYGKNPDGSINPMKLTIYKNNYFLRDFDPNLPTGDQQNYYSRAEGSLNATNNFVLNGASLINFDDFKGELIYENTSFKPSSDPIKTTTGEGDAAVTTQSAPALNVSLSTAFWQAAIIDKGGATELSNASSFKNYFRGLYFKAEAIDGKGNMILLNLSGTNANITINYTKNPTTEGGARIKGTYVLNFKGGNILNTFTNNFTQPLASGDPVLGDSKLYLKGAEGAMAVVDLFSGQKVYTDENGNSSTVSALDYFKKTYRVSDGNGGYKKDAITGNYKLKRLINDAILTVYEDKDMATQGPYANGDAYHKYDRLFAYDIKNNTTLTDYGFDPTTNNTADPFNSTYFHLGQRQTDAAGVSKYKIHLTEHLNNILLRDASNDDIKIGLVLSSNVNQVNSAKLLNIGGEVTAIPAAAVITPRGTVLRGTNTSDAAKMTLQVFFTAPK
ncbi:DUF4270 domain-containing protein [Mariniflexile maritimum]|uniref:DUF4270 domain-containing protein n=1 Tax=Mariniflexile maritimum TaxID=2682493 RepID=UPI0012F676EB|nr:DUF4270 domain-containing protein [Mariniflexile maritimum]